jgi:hypothetical protein
VLRTAGLIVTLGILSAPLTAEAQQAGKVYRIGYLGNSSPVLESDLVDAFRQGLRDLGYVEGRNIVIEYRWAEGRYERFPEFAAELVRLKVDLIRQRPGALFIIADRFLLTHRARIVEFAAQRKLPAMYPYREYVEGGGLISYAPSFLDMFRRSATHVDKIFKGAKPGDLPVEQPTRFELVINLKTAKALGLTIPQSVLIRAYQVIQ